MQSQPSKLVIPTAGAVDGKARRPESGGDRLVHGDMTGEGCKDPHQTAAGLLYASSTSLQRMDRQQSVRWGEGRCTRTTAGWDLAYA